LIDTIIASMPGVVYLFGEPGELMRRNRNLECISGYSAEEVALMHPLDFFVGGRKNFHR
jgi:PAS domain-containing protein